MVWTVDSSIMSHNPRNTDQYPIRISLSEPLLPQPQLGKQPGGSFYDYRSPTTSSHILTDEGTAHLTPVTHSAAQNRTDVRKTSQESIKLKLLSENIEILTLI